MRCYSYSRAQNDFLSKCILVKRRDCWKLQRATMQLAVGNQDSQGNGQLQAAVRCAQHVTFCLAPAVSVPVGSQMGTGNMNTVSLVPVTLADGSIAYIQCTPAETYGQNTLKTVQLADGTTAYIEHTVQIPQSNTIVAAQVDECVRLSDTITVSDFSDGTIDAETLSVLEEYASKADKPATKLGVMETNQDTAVPMQIGVRSKVRSSGKTINCDYAGCGKRNPTAHQLRAHERWHTSGKAYVCDVHGCGKKYGSREGYLGHLKIHTGERPYRCQEPTCGKSFKTSGALKTHVRIHTGERAFACPFKGCGRTFNDPGIRKVHIRKHTGERPYVCAEPGCGRSFVSGNNYRNHVRIHTGEKPYLCTVPGCEKRFTEYSSLYKHQAVHIPFNPYSCSKCGNSYKKMRSLFNHKCAADKDTELVEEEQETYVKSPVGEP